jgi:hypothetical protein
VENLLQESRQEDLLVIRFLRIDRERGGDFSVALFEVIDEGNKDFLDIYEFSPIDPDFPFGKMASFKSADDAVSYSKIELSADENKFVNAGIIQGEYKDRYHPSW